MTTAERQQLSFHKAIVITPNNKLHGGRRWAIDERKTGHCCWGSHLCLASSSFSPTDPRTFFLISIVVVASRVLSLSLKKTATVNYLKNRSRRGHNKQQAPPAHPQDYASDKQNRIGQPGTYVMHRVRTYENNTCLFVFDTHSTYTHTSRAPAVHTQQYACVQQSNASFPKRYYHNTALSTHTHEHAKN